MFKSADGVRSTEACRCASQVRGVDLETMAAILIKYGAVNAINLDGGGSATFAHNGALANYVSDECSDAEEFSCERPITTILCIHSLR
jgi:N-acetylglucosamine-1-phosphodiester alpha-N-acetylglucosaminidase